MFTGKRGLSYARLIVPHPQAGPQSVYDTLRRARVTAPTYAGDVVILDLDVTARAYGLLCVAQHDPDWGVWRA